MIKTIYKSFDENEKYNQRNTNKTFSNIYTHTHTHTHTNIYMYIYINPGSYKSYFPKAVTLQFWHSKHFP